MVDFFIANFSRFSGMFWAGDLEGHQWSRQQSRNSMVDEFHCTRYLRITGPLVVRFRCATEPLLCFAKKHENWTWYDMFIFFGGGWPKTKVVTETALRRVVGRLLKYIWYIYIHLFIYIDIIYLKPQNQSNSSVWWNTVWTHYVKTLSKPHWAFCPIWL